MRRSAGILSLTACALRTSAFLLPPGFTVSSGHRPDPVALLDPLRSKSHVLTLPCSECAFSLAPDVHEEANNDVYHIQGGANSVLLNFTIAEDGQSLEFNGNSIYPLQVVHENLNKAYVKQVASSASLDDIKTGDVRYTPLEVTGSGVVVQHEEAITPEGDMLIPVKHTIYELEGQSVSVDEVAINLLKTTAGGLYILHVETIERQPPRPDDTIRPPHGDIDMFFPPPPPHRNMGPPPPHHPTGPPHHTDNECKVLPPALCRLRNMLEAKITDIKHGDVEHRYRKRPCPGFPVKGGPARYASGRTSLPFDFTSPGRPHHSRPHHGHHHRHHHSFFESFSRGFAAVLIPTLAGIAVGMMVSLLGLVVGRVIGYLWIKLYRGGRRGYASVALDESSAEAADGEKGLEVESEEDDLPAYERPPAYDDTAPTKEDK